MAAANQQPHSLSLKVLRLTRPTLATQSALPDVDFGEGLSISSKSSLACAAAKPSSFPLTPLLTLPATFGLAYVGESFACTLCVNNELERDADRTVEDIQIVATMQSPSDQAGTVLATEQAQEHGTSTEPLNAGQTMQFVVRQDLKESGAHVLAITVTYTESMQGDAGERVTRTRTFKKLYQFVAQQLIAVRSKVSNMSSGSGAQRRWIIEAQLENVGESSVTLEQVEINHQEGLEGEALASESLRDVPMSLKPQDVEQLMFLVRDLCETSGPSARRQLAQLKVRWRGALGEPGQMSTGWLTSKG